MLACGVFGDVADEDMARTMRCCAGLCAPGGTVEWTHGAVKLILSRILSWFAAKASPWWASRSSRRPERDTLGGQRAAASSLTLPRRRSSPLPGATCWSRRDHTCGRACGRQQTSPADQVVGERNRVRKGPQAPAGLDDDFGGRTRIVAAQRWASPATAPDRAGRRVTLAGAGKARIASPVSVPGG